MAHCRILPIKQNITTKSKTTKPMRQQNFSATLLVIAFIFSLVACKAPTKLLETGNYDDAINVSLKRISGKKKKSEHVAALEDAFAKAMYQDLRLIDNLKAENRSENWIQIFDLYTEIDHRQQKIEPLVPLIDENGYEAKFKFIRVAPLITEAKENAADHHYNAGLAFMDNARRGDKLAARSAFAEFDAIGRYYSSYKQRSQLLEEAHTLGITHVIIKTSNASLASLPPNFEQVLLDFSVSDINTQWKQYHTTPQSGLNFDYTINVKLTEIGLGPEVQNSREYIDHKEIEDGFDYVLDDNGNVMKDSLGNDIKVPRTMIIKANVIEVFQQKIAGVSGRIEYIDNNTNNMLRAENINVDAVFENYASTYMGDKRALSEESWARIGNQPLPFPTNEALLMQAAQQLQPAVKQKIAYARLFQ